MLTAVGLELRAGARLLIEAATFRVGPGDRVGLVGRNGAGKTTLCKVLAGEGAPAAGGVERTSTVGYLPQDPRTGDLDTIARDRVLSARGIDQLLRDMEKAQIALGERPYDEALIRRYGRLEERFTALGGYSAEAEAERICSNLGLPERGLDQPLRTLSGGQRRRVEIVPIPGRGPEASTPVRRAAPAGRARAHPVLRREHAAPRRTDQPPRRRLDHLVTRLPALLQRGARRHQPRRRPARACRQQGVPSRRHSRRARPLQRRLEVLPAAA